MKTRKVPFDIYLPATEHRAAVKVDTIRIEVYTDDFGSERVTPASTQLIEKTQARYMGLLAAEDIRALRERHGLSQDQLSDLLGCGKKSLSRWENGREYPSQLVNTLLRLLADDVITPDDLRAVRQPLAPPPTKSKKSRTGPIPVQNPTRSIRRKIQKTGLGIRSPRRSHSLSNLPLQETPENLIPDFESPMSGINRELHRKHSSSSLTMYGSSDHREGSPATVRL